MIRIGIAVVIILALGGFIYWQGGKDTRNTADETKHIREKDISDAINDSKNTPAWREWLQSRDK